MTKNLIPTLIAFLPEQLKVLAGIAKKKGISRGALVRLVVGDFLKVEAARARAEVRAEARGGAA